MIEYVYLRLGWFASMLMRFDWRDMRSPRQVLRLVVGFFCATW